MKRLAIIATLLLVGCSPAANIPASRSSANNAASIASLTHSTANIRKPANQLDREPATNTQNRPTAPSASTVQQPDDNAAAFQHKQQCAQDISLAQQQMKQYDQDNSIGGMTQASILGRVFYSNSRASCLYTFTSGVYDYQGKHVMDMFWVADALSGERLMNEAATWGDPNYDSVKARFYSSLSQYQ